VKILPKPVIFDIVPAGADPQPQPAARQDVEVGGLLGGKRGLALRQDDDAGDELDPLGHASEIAERDERLVERVLLVIAAEQRRVPALVHRPQDMVVDQEMVVAEQFGRSADAAKGARIAVELDLRIDDAQLHRGLPAKAAA